MKITRKYHPRAAAIILSLALILPSGCSVQSLTSREAVLSSIVIGASTAGIGAVGAGGRKSLKTIVPVAGAIGAGVGLLTGAMMHERRNPSGTANEQVVVVRKPALPKDAETPEAIESPDKTEIEPQLRDETTAARLPEASATGEDARDEEEEQTEILPYQGPSL
jgi:hypothetical protein